MKVMKLKSVHIIVMLILLSVSLSAQYKAGDYLTSQDMSKSLAYCSNETGSTTLNDLLQPPTQVLFINFFASY